MNPIYEKIKQNIKTTDWQRAAYGGMIYVLGMFVIVGIIYIGLSYGISILVDQNTAMAGLSGIAQSQVRVNTLNVMLKYWYIIPIFVGVITLVYIIKYGIESDQGGNAY